ncbi:DUF2778 domain-containing protein [Bradyrhizobium ivorense]|uniref:DUF2778 domain-containing protein n=1 Tax=Bradyrhizobium ivorense TaxID=2511166 RepID=UPI001121EBBC|nr:DUF2778 domain-containing protein [Bradyrhizobium ivorense]
MLTYSIAREFLSVAIDSTTFSVRAYSGGGRGRTGGGAEHSFSSYDAFRKERDIKAGHTHGGPIPPGFYVCHYVPLHPPFHGPVIQLEQTITSLLNVDAPSTPRLYGRDKFWIHGSGKHGSDGCIVIEDKYLRDRLNNAVKNAKNAVLLKVVEPGFPLPAARAMIRPIA